MAYGQMALTTTTQLWVACSRSPPRRVADLTHVAGMSQRIPSGLRPNGQAMGFLPDRHFNGLAIRGVDGIDDVVVAAGKPQRLPIGADIPHIGASASWNHPRRFDGALGEIEH